MNNKKVVVKEELCPKNHACPMINVCPVKAISQKGYDAPEINPEKCIACGLCTKNCPYGAFTFAD